MKKSTLLPILIYLIVSVAVIFLPASEGYNTIGWKIFVGQAYALPILLISFLVTYFFSKNSKISSNKA